MDVESVVVDICDTIDIDAIPPSVLVDKIESPSKIFCYICYDSVTSENTLCKFACNHQFCKECFVGFARSHILEGRTQLSCFHPVQENNGCAVKNCNMPIQEVVLRSLICDDADLLKKFDRFLLLKSNERNRECLKCMHVQLGDPAIPIMTCIECQNQYCFFHANAHCIDQTCEEYEKGIASELQPSIALINDTSKPCPKCSQPIMKSGGCNHMKCTQCGQAFCWLCGKGIDDDVFPAHFQWWNPSGCSNLQMNEEIEPSSTARFMAKALSFIELIILGPIALLSTMISLILCCCCIPKLLNCQKHQEGKRTQCTQLMSHCMSGWGIFWIGVLVVLPLSLIILAVMVGVAIILYPFYACVRIYRGFYPWPDELTRCAHIYYNRCRCCSTLCCLTADRTIASPCLKEDVGCTIAELEKFDSDCYKEDWNSVSIQTVNSEFSQNVYSNDLNITTNEFDERNWVSFQPASFSINTTDSISSTSSVSDSIRVRNHPCELARFDNGSNTWYCDNRSSHCTRNCEGPTVRWSCRAHSYDNCRGCATFYSDPVQGTVPAPVGDPVTVSINVTHHIDNPGVDYEQEGWYNLKSGDKPENDSDGTGSKAPLKVGKGKDITTAQADCNTIPNPI